MNHAVIAIDDEPHNLMLIESYLDGSGHTLTCFDGAAKALAYLKAGGAADTILLDRMMPEMDGLAFMREFKALPSFPKTPVIMQTAAAGTSEIVEGIAAGAYYYLVKPYARDVLNAIVARALADHTFHQGLEKSVAQMNQAMGHLEAMCLSFCTLDDVRAISFFLASLFPTSDTVLLGITELMLNAVEHGNLGITYNEKSMLIRNGSWQEEVEHRQTLPEHVNKRALVTFARDAQGLVLTIEDTGTGFDWTKYAGFDRERARDSHGRGIAMSRMVSFDEVTYIAPGNKVVCRKNRPCKDQ